MILLTDKYERVNKSKPKLIAAKGTKVTVVTTEHDPVYICEHNGVRFPINKMYLK